VEEDVTEKQTHGTLIPKRGSIQLLILNLAPHLLKQGFTIKHLSEAKTAVHWMTAVR
jgi:hypothetical protein